MFSDSLRSGGNIRGPLKSSPRAIDEVPFLITGVLGQTADLLQIKSSVGTVLMSLDADGNLIVAGSTTTVDTEVANDFVVNDALTVGGLATFNGNVLIGDSGTDLLTVTATSQFTAAAKFTGLLTATNVNIIGKTTMGAELTVDGLLQADSAIYANAGIVMADDMSLWLGGSNDSTFRYNTIQTPDTLFAGVSADSNGLVIAEVGDIAFDFAHAQQTNPTVFIHSANQATDEWISLTHDQTDAIISAGTGDIKIDADLSVTGDYNMSFPIDLGEDSGFLTLFDKEVSATPAAGTNESVYMSIDHEDFLSLYAEADSSGGLQNESVRAYKRFQTKQGTDIASATNIVIPNDGNTFELTGTTKVDLISNLGFQNGAEITLVANESVDIDDGTATSGTNITITLAGGADFSMTADDTLKLVLSSTTASGQAWRELSRSAN